MNPAFAIIGCGGIGQKRLASLLPHGPTMVCDLDIDRAKRLALQIPGCQATASFEEVLRSESVDAVVVSTINAELAPISLAAAKAGKHVLVEKPAAITVSELEKVAEAAKHNGVLVRVGYNHRFHPACLKSLEILSSGAMGPILFVRGRYGHGGRLGYESEWRGDPELSGGGELLDQGVHLIDLAGLFLGKFTTVEGHAATYFWKSPVEDNAFLSLRNASGGTAWLHASCTEWKNLFSLEVYGRDAKLHWEGLGGSYGTERLAFYKMLPQMGPPDTTIYEFPQGDSSWKLEMKEFFEDIHKQRVPVPGLQEARAVLEVVESIYARKS